MASFTDNSQALSNFNPYIQQVPTSAYIDVGMQKQQQYDEGVQKTQESIDSVANLPVIKQEQKDYLNQRMNSLMSSVSKVVGQDFSNSQLVNQIGGLTSQIAHDPIIQSAVTSTMHYQAEAGKMAQAQKEGKSNIANETVFQDQFQSWLNDKDVKSQFSGSYTPYIDVNKKLLGEINANLKPSEQIQELPFEMENGHVKLVNGAPVINSVMIKQTSKGLSPEILQAAMATALGPDELNQLGIEGEYTYRGYGKGDLKKVNDESYQHTLNLIDQNLRGFAVQKLSNTTDRVYQEDLDNKIRQFQLQKDSLIGTDGKSGKYASDMQLLNSNPTAFKRGLYTQNFMTNMVTQHSASVNSLEYVDNPYRKAYDDQVRNSIEAEKFRQDYGEHGFKAQQLEIERARVNIEALKAEKEAKAAKTKPGEAPGLTDSLLPPVQVPLTKANVPDINMKTVAASTQGLQDEVTGATLQIAQQKWPEMVHRDRDTGAIVYNDAASKTFVETSLAKLTNDANDPTQTVDPDIKDYVARVANTKLRLDNRNAGTAGILKKAGVDVFDNLPGMMVTSSNPNIGAVHITGAEIGEFARKLPETMKAADPIFTGPGMGGGPVSFSMDDTKADEQFATPSEKLMYAAVKKAYNHEPLSDAEQKIVSQVGKATDVLGTHRQQIDTRTKYINEHIKDLFKAEIPADFPIQAGKPEEKYPIKSIVNSILGSYPDGTDKIPGGATVSNIAKMMEKPEATTYALRSMGNNQFGLVVSNSALKLPSQVIPLSQADLEANFPGANVNQFSTIMEGLTYSKALGKVTTDVQNNGVMSAFSLSNPNLSHYAVKYHVEEPRNGAYQVKVYIKDGSGKDFSSIVPLDYLVDLKGLSNFLSNFGDEQVSQMLAGPKK